MTLNISLEPRSFVSEGHPISGPRSTTIDPRQFRASRLIAQVADGWLIYSDIAGLADTTIINRASTIRSLGSFLGKKSDGLLSLNAPGRELVDRFYAWEKEQLAVQPPGSDRPSKLARELKNFVKAYLVKYRIDNPSVQRWADSRALQDTSDHHPLAPLDEFSNAERLLMERAFKNVIRAGEALLEIGDNLLKQGKNPIEHGWNSLPNCVWGLKHLSMNDVPREFWAPTRREKLWNQISEHAPAIGSLEHSYFGNPIVGLVYPHLLHIQAIHCLLILTTGWAPEEVGGLCPSDLQIEPDKVRARTVKNRAHKIRFRELPRSGAASGGWRSGDLIVRCCEAQRNIDIQSTGFNSLWLGALTRKGRHWEGIVRPLNAGQQFDLSALIDACKIDISKPHDRRRLRKTTKSAKAVLLGTLAGSAGDDHSVEVFRHHYAQTTTVHTIAAKTVLSAQEKVMENLGPAVVPYRASELQARDVPKEIEKAFNETKYESTTDEQLALTACTDPYDPPHATGPLCLDAPRKCLECRNAVIFAEHVPRLKTYRDLLKKLEPTMVPQQFDALYGLQLVNIDAALAQFPEAIESSDRFNVPLTMRTVK